MPIVQLPADWEPTRSTLQKYAHAVMALPRVGAHPDPRWGHVAMVLDGEGLVASPVPLDDGTVLVSKIDFSNDQIVIDAGDTTQAIDITSGPSPQSIGEAIVSVAAAHGSTFDVDAQRYADDGSQEYDRDHAAAFWSVASTVAEVFESINETVEGEVAGPHLWPHGFDIATEWYSKKSVDYDGAPASAQIAIGWYPAGEAYFYANPWPFEDVWTASELVEGATWHSEGWQGAKLAVADIAEGSGTETVAALGERIHTIARHALSA